MPSIAAAAAGEEATPGKYTQFWGAFGKAMKLGVIEDASNKQRLAKLVRVHSTHDPDALTSLDAYISRMPESQKEIYYLAGASFRLLQTQCSSQRPCGEGVSGSPALATSGRASAGTWVRRQAEPPPAARAGESKDEVLRSPFLERLREEGLEVILFTDAIDEYMMQHLQEYDDRKLINISKDNLKLGGKDKDDKAADKATKARPACAAGHPVSSTAARCRHAARLRMQRLTCGSMLLVRHR